MNSMVTLLETRFFRQVLPHLLAIVALLAIFLVYTYSIFHEQILLVGHGDIGARFQIAIDYARDPSHALDIGNHVFAHWLGVWPPIPFIIQGLILRFVLFPGMSNADAGIIAVELTSVFLTLLGLYFIGRTVTLQVNEFAGLLACIMGFCASILFYLAHTGLAEVYTFFLISVAIYNLFRFIKKNQGLSWSVLFFSLAFFCRSESVIIALFSGVVLIAHRKWTSAIILMGTIVFLVAIKLLGAFFLIEGTKFFEHSPSGQGNSTYIALRIRLRKAWVFLKSFGVYNQKLILLFYICILPLFTFGLKLKNNNFFRKSEIQNESNDYPKELIKKIRRIGAFTLFNKIYSQISWLIINIPITFWIICFLLSMGVIFGELIRGNISGQFRYLFMANIFMTTLISLIAYQTIHIFYFRKSRLAKQLAISLTTILVVFSLWSGFTHANGQYKPELLWNLSPSYKQVVSFIRKHSNQDDRVVFDNLSWDDQRSFVVYLLNPSLEPINQFSRKFRYIGRDKKIESLLPKQLPTRQDEIRALLHAFIHLEKPRFFILRSDMSYDKFIKPLKKRNSAQKTRKSMSPIRDYLTSVETDKRQFIFKSPNIFPEVEIPLTKVYETKDFIILEKKV